MKFIKRAERTFDRFLDILAAFSSILICFMLCIVCYEVVARYFFNAPTTWVVEICSIVLLFTPFLVGGWVLRRDGHVKMEIVLDLFSPKTQVVLKTITSFLAAFTCLILFFYGTKVALELYRTHYFTNTLLRLPKGPLLAIIPFGFLLLFIQSLRKALGILGERLHPRAQPHDPKK